MTNPNTTAAAERVEKLRRMIAETNRDCLMSSWLELLDTAQAVATDYDALAAALADHDRQPTERE